MNKLTIIIPARSGSKRLTDKNIYPLAGKPLVFYTIDAAIGHPEVSYILFTSDSLKYIDMVEKEYGKKVICIHRPIETASDKTKVTDEIKRLIVEEPEYYESGWFSVLLPTAPLRNFNILKSCIDRYRMTQTALFSCHKHDFPPQFSFGIKDDKWYPLFGDDSPMVTGNTRSQDIAQMYRPNGAIYIQKVETFLKRKIFYDDAIPFIMDQEVSIDIDTLQDINYCEYIMNNSGLDS